MPLAFVVAGANQRDLPLLERTWEGIPPPLEVRRRRLLRRARQKGLYQSQNLCLDAGYDSAKARLLAHEFGLCPTSAISSKRLFEKSEKPITVKSETR